MTTRDRKARRSAPGDPASRPRRARRDPAEAGAPPGMSRGRQAGTILGALFFLIAGCIAGVYTSRTVPTPEPSATGSALSPPAAPGRIQVELQKVVDGDTIAVILDGQVQKVRYLGIDTPESYASTSSGIEYLGKEAGARNEAILRGRSITLEYDGPRTDRFGRVLAYVFAGDVDVCKQLLVEGYAEVYRKAPNIRHYADYLAAEEAARQAGCGVWDASAKAAWEILHPPKSKR